MHAKSIKKALILLFIIILLIIITIIIRKPSTNSSNEIANNTNDSLPKYTFNFGEPIDLDSEYEDNGRVVQGTSSDANYGYVSELFDTNSMWNTENYFVVETAHGHVIYANEWVNEGPVNYLPQPSFGFLGRLVIQDVIATATYSSVDYKDFLKYIDDVKNSGYNIVINETNNKRKKIYSGYLKNDNEMIFNAEYDNGNVKIRIKI